MSREVQQLVDGPSDARWTIALAHGAGVGMDSGFMACFASGLAAAGHRVVRFEFPYMAQRRQTGKQKPRDREPVLRDTWQQVIGQFDASTLVIGGKSMGGRIASMIADEANVAGLVCLGYPFHPTGKPDRLRIDHLRALTTPALFLQGERDPFGKPDEVQGYDLPASLRIHWIHDGDHSFKPRKASGRTESENWNDALHEFNAFVKALRDRS